MDKIIGAAEHARQGFAGKIFENAVESTPPSGRQADTGVTPALSFRVHARDGPSGNRPLPEPSDEALTATDVWLKVEGVPAKYDRLLLQADLYRQTDSGWSEFRVAPSDRPVLGPKNLWQHSLSLTAPEDQSGLR